MGRLTLMAIRSGRRRAQALSGHEIVHDHVLMRAPRRRTTANAGLVERPSVVVYTFERPPDSEIAGGADIAPAEVPREKPLRGPTPETAHGGNRVNDLLVRLAAERIQVQSAGGDETSKADDVLRLPSGQLQASKRADIGAREPFRVRKAIDRLAGNVDRNAEVASE